MNCFIFTEPFTQYRVQVRAITGGGKGDFSDVYPVYTDVAGKNQINKKIEQKANVFIKSIVRLLYSGSVCDYMCMYM